MLTVGRWEMLAVAYPRGYPGISHRGSSGGYFGIFPEGLAWVSPGVYPVVLPMVCPPQNTPKNIKNPTLGQTKTVRNQILRKYYHGLTRNPPGLILTSKG